MTVVAYSRARFTEADLSIIDAIAQPRIARGLWAGVSRQTSPDCDRVLVYLPRSELPTFRFERARRGTYTLWFQDRCGSHVIGSGQSAAECLSIWTLGQKGAGTSMREVSWREVCLGTVMGFSLGMLIVLAYIALLATGVM
jgi:hypothetical protein